MPYAINHLTSLDDVSLSKEARLVRRAAIGARNQYHAKIDDEYTRPHEMMIATFEADDLEAMACQAEDEMFKRGMKPHLQDGPSLHLAVMKSKPLFVASFPTGKVFGRNFQAAQSQYMTRASAKKSVEDYNTGFNGEFAPAVEKAHFYEYTAAEVLAAFRAHGY